MERTLDVDNFYAAEAQLSSRQKQLAKSEAQ